MAQLRNTRWEKFAQQIAKGMSIVDSYQVAGYAAKTYSASATLGSRLFKKVEIQERVDELRRAGATRAEISVERVLRELAGIGFANMSEFVRIDDNGHPQVDLSTLTPHQAAAISETRTECVLPGVLKDGKKAGDPDCWQSPPEYKIMIKLHPKIPALVKLGEHVGAFDGEGGKQQPVQFFFSDQPMSEADWMDQHGIDDDQGD